MFKNHKSYDFCQTLFNYFHEGALANSLCTAQVLEKLDGVVELHLVHWIYQQDKKESRRKKNGY